MSANATGLGGTPGGFPATGIVPIETVERNRRKPELPDQEFAEALLKPANRYYSTVEDQFKRLHRRHERASEYLRGRQFLDIDPETNELYEYRPSDQYALINNQFEPMIDASVATIATNARRLVAKCSSRDIAYRSRLRDVQHWVDGDRPFGVEDELVMAYQWKMRGAVWAVNAPSLTGPETKDPVTQPMQLTGGSPSFWCADCGAGGYLDAQQPAAPAPAEGVPALGQAEALAPGATPMGGAAGVPAATPGAPPAGPAPMDVAPSCPECGSANVEVNTPITTTVDQVMGFKTRASVLIETELVDDLEWFWYVPSRTPMKSGWIERRRWVMKTLLQSKFSWANLDNTATGSGNAEDMSFGASLEQRLAGSVGGYSSDPWSTSRRQVTAAGSQDQVMLREIWYRPWELRSIRIAKNATLGNGKQLPANTTFDKIFPKGCCVTVTGMTVLDVRAASIDDEIVYCAAKLTPEYGFPRACESMLENQDRLNFFESYEMVSVATSAADTVVADGEAFRGAQLRKKLGQPGAVVFMEALLPNERWEQKIGRLRGGSANTDINAHRQNVVGSMSAQNGTFGINPMQIDGGPGAGGNTLDTATGVRAVTDLEQRLQQPMLRLLYGFRARLATTRFRMAQRYCVDPLYIETKDPMGRGFGRMMTAADIDGDYFIEPDEESFQVRSNSEKRQDLVAAINLGAFDPNVAPEQRRAIAVVFGLDDMFETAYLTWQEKAYGRLELMKAAAEQGWQTVEQQLPVAVAEFQRLVAEGAISPYGPDGQPIDPEKVVLDMFAQQILELDPISPVDDSSPFIETYQAFWSTSECEDADPLTQRVIELAFEARKRSIGEQAVQDQLMARDVMQPLVDANMQDVRAVNAKQAADADAEFGRQEQSKDADVDRQQQLNSAEPAAQPGA